MECLPGEQVRDKGAYSSPSSIASVLECSPALLHLDDLGSRQPRGLELPVQVTDRELDQLFV